MFTGLIDHISEISTDTGSLMKTDITIENDPSKIPESRCMLHVNNRNKFHSCSTLSEFDQGEKLRVHVAFFEQVF